MEKRITVFTPTYNRKYILPKLYDSLCCQERKDFLWLIVDDGSTDGTEELVRQWMSDSVLDIEYHYQENRGKMAAHNEGVRLCTTELFVCVDSDDLLASPSVIGDTLDFWDKNSSVAQLADNFKAIENTTFTAEELAIIDQGAARGFLPRSRG